MNKIFALICIYTVSSINLAVFSQSGSIGIGTNTPHSSAVLEVQSDNKGMLTPQMTTTQRNGIASPATGLLVFDNTTNSFWFYNGNAWTELVNNGSSDNWTKSGNHIMNSNTGNIGIGSNAPIYDLYINRPSPAIGFFDVAKNHFSGLISGDSSNIEIAAYKKPLGDLNGVPGNLLLQTNTTGTLPSLTRIAGNVGIGESKPTEKLDVDGGIRLSGKLLHTAINGANMIPICYGVISANGGIISGTRNFTVTKPGLGHYRVTIEGLSGSSPSVLVTNNQVAGLTTVTAVFSNNILDIYCLIVDFEASGTPGNPDVFNGVNYLDMKFSFLVYKN